MTDTENVLEALERREDLTESERSLCATIRRLSSELVKAQADRDACAADARQYQERLARVVEAAKVRREESSAMAASLDQAKAEIAALKANVKRKDGDANESFDREAEAFHKATGMLMPGKNIRAGADWTDDDEVERRKLFKVWCAGVDYVKTNLSRRIAEARRLAFQEALGKWICSPVCIFGPWLEKVAAPPAPAEPGEVKP